MSLPEKKIKTVQLPDSNTYEIIPERLQKNSYEAALPSLTQNSVLALSSDIKYIPHFPSAISGTAAVETSPYTSTHWDATCDEVTSLYDGMVMIIRVPVEGSGNCGVGLKINNGTYHPVVYNITKTVGARYGANSTIIAVYNANQSASIYSNSASTTSVTGVWQVYDYDSDTDTTFRLRNYSAIYVNKSGQSTNRRTLLFEVDGGLSATNKTIAIGTTKVPINFKYIPGGQIRYYSTSGAIAANANFSASGLWEQYALDIRYSFNTGSTLVEGNPVYIRMIVNSDGTLSQDASSSGDNPIVQALPSIADNKVYVYLGRAGSTTTLELEPVHPIYEYKNGAIRLWTNAVSSGGTATDVQINGTSITSNNVANIVTNSAYNSSSNKIATMSDISRAIIPAFTDNYTSFSSDIRDYIIGSMTMRPSIIFMARITPYPGEFLVTCIPNENKFIITNDNERYVATVNDIYGSDYVWASLMTSANKVDYATMSDISSAIDALPEPMVFKGSVGTNGTVTWANLPAAASTNEGHTYKVITDHTSAPICKVGDTIISNGSEWIVIPSGDEPSGTVTSVGLSVPTGLSVSGSPITSSGTLAISYASGYSIPTTSKQSEWNNKQSALTTSSVNDGTLDKAIGFDASGNLVKGTAGSSITFVDWS